jgi:hypothetical protein
LIAQHAPVKLRIAAAASLMVDVLPTPGLPSIPVCVMRKSRRSGCGGCLRRPTAPGLRAVPTVSLPTNGSLSREEFESIGSEAVRETIEKFETTDHRLSLTVSRQNPVLRTGTFANFLNSPWGPFDKKPTHRATSRLRRNLRVFRLSKRSSLPQRLACCIRRTVFPTTHRKNLSKI